jgi:uncharacterized MnhB-related membrane protein
MIEKIILLLLLALAIIIIVCKQYKRTVIFLGIFSLLSALLYVIYSAPDVAIAEAVIGCGLSTVFYLVAIKKAEIFKICVLNYNQTIKENSDLNILMESIKKDIEKKNLSCEINSSVKSVKEAMASEPDLIIHENIDSITIYGLENDYIFEGLCDDIGKSCAIDKKISITKVSDVKRYKEAVNE